MEKINIAELLKDCPTGMELDCTMYEDASFAGITEDLNFQIRVKINIENAKKGNWIQEITLTSEGKLGNHPNAKCIIFPKGKTTWEGFQRPFKDGDIVVTTLSNIAIIRKPIGEKSFYIYGSMFDNDFYKDETTKVNVKRLASEEEKAKLFDAIKANGYRWNPETKTLEKLPKFKVGDRITDKNKFIYRITEITDKGYKLHDLKTTFITFEEADLYFVKVMDVFDINSLIPFESRVLVRSSYGCVWRPAIYGFTYSGKHYVVGGIYWMQCIPFEPNKELLGTTNDCDDFYKTWEK